MIEIASRQDIPALVALINSAYRGEGSKQGWTTEADLIQGLRTDEENLGEIIADPATTFLKYSNEEGQIVACMRLQQQQDRLYLGMLTVSPGLQAQGLGKKLLKAAEEMALAKNCRSIFMTVFSVRSELVAWYERHGYQKTGKVIPFKHNEKFEIVTQELEFFELEKFIG
jgi:ribosomal protein S18 acetylase RimI-like enzyme